MSEDQAGFANTDDVEIDIEKIRKAIKPLLWRVLICPVQPREMSSGGIALPVSATDGEAHLNYIGRVVALGPLAGKSEKFQNPIWSPDLPAHILHQTPQYLWGVKEGDWVVFSRYAGQRMEWKGIKLLQANDDEILGVISDPKSFRVYA